MDKLNITYKVLDKLGFSEYWDEHGTWGGRTLTFSNGTKFRIIEQCQMDDDTEGYHSGGKYVNDHFYFVGWFAIPAIKDLNYFDLFFLHEMYQCIETVYPDCLGEFVEKCKAVKMGSYIDSYLETKN